jgi:hypothetical protein
VQPLACLQVKIGSLLSDLQADISKLPTLYLERRINTVTEAINTIDVSIDYLGALVDYA